MQLNKLPLLGYTQRRRSADQHTNPRLWRLRANVSGRRRLAWGRCYCCGWV